LTYDEIYKFSSEGERTWQTNPERNARIPIAAVKQDQIASIAVLSAKRWRKRRISIASAVMRAARVAQRKNDKMFQEKVPQRLPAAEELCQAAESALIVT
jgi:hypothetical protein